MARYVDGFVLPVPKKNIESYRKMAETAGKVWLKHGALEGSECVADDVQPGQLTSFPQAVHLKEDETIVFAWIVYSSREHRDAVNKAVFDDPVLKEQMNPETMPCDGKRMFSGGFTTLVEMHPA